MWNAISEVSGGFALAAFLAAVVLSLYQAYLNNQTKSLEALPLDKRSDFINAKSIGLNIDTSGLSADQKYNLALTVLKNRADIVKNIFNAVIFFGLISGSLAAISIYSNNTNKVQIASDNSRVWLKIKGMTPLTGTTAKSNGQITINVNGANYRYPSQAGVQWLELGINMVQEIYELPNSDDYRLSFSALISDPSSKSQPQQLASQGADVVSSKSIPVQKSYAMYPINSSSHASSAVSVIIYELTRNPN
ncbi:hypothetical protein MKK88_03370 [Methylobacterium sp. E-005]|uniref:hypothetical protein n=1 Tax=Methylobacterium sp. E-005 TaxID=2836549 RepID=UPI001FB9D41D|nr:hypothetical protein [Methylobacterium sp. E-005]MCJ2085036.1 hypothetical protein [Methylobacterium sp. E-005]